MTDKYEEYVRISRKDLEQIIDMSLDIECFTNIIRESCIHRQLACYDTVLEHILKMQRKVNEYFSDFY